MKKLIFFCTLILLFSCGKKKEADKEKIQETKPPEVKVSTSTIYTSTGGEIEYS